MENETSCGAVVYSGEDSTRKYLLLNHGAGHWSFPKGHVEIGESEKETMLRELEEETGIRDVVFIDGFCEKIEYTFQRKRETVQKQVTFFLVRSPSDSVALSSEHKGFAWVEYAQARSLLTHENSKRILDKAHEFRNP